jgi:hypothetical protein
VIPGSKRACIATLAAGIVVLPSHLEAAVLRSAAIHINITSPVSCEVTMALEVSEASEIDHRVEAFDGSRVELIELTNAREIGEQRLIGRTQSLVLRPDASRYQFRYRAQQPMSRADRCPIWLPAVPTDGQTRAVTIQVELPPSTTPASAMPSFTWRQGHGSTTLGHVPAFVRVSYVGEGESAGWTVASSMDALTMAMIAAVSAFWFLRRRRKA